MEQTTMEKIIFEADGETVEFYVLEQTVLGGVSYLLVTPDMEGDSEALILKDLSGTQDLEAVYEIVDDDTELQAVAAVFSEILDDVDLV